MFNLPIFLFLNSTYLIGYIGPGMGGGIIAAILGIISAFLLALWGIIYYPIKRALKNRRKRKKKKGTKNRLDSSI